MCLYCRARRLTIVAQKHPAVQQDDCPPHKHEEVVAFFKRNGITTLDDWPACSPDFSPVECTWATVAGEVTKAVRDAAQRQL